MTSIYKIFFFVALALLFPLTYAHAQDEDMMDEDQSAVAEEQADAPAPPPAVLKDGTVGNYLSGQFARESGDVESAIRYLRHAHQSNPQNVDIGLELQGLLLLNGNMDEAVQLAKSMPQDSQRDSLTALLLCLDAAKRGDLDAANGILNAAADTSTGQLWLPLVGAWVDVGRHTLDKPLKLEALPVDASHAAALTNYHLALINAQAGFVEAAAENFRKAVADVSNPPPRIMMLMAKFYDENKRPAALEPLVTAWRKDNADAEIATQDVSAVVTPQDGIAEVLFTMGSVVQNAGAPQDAVIYLNMARYLRPDFSLVTISLGDAYSDLRQYDKANVIYASVPNKSPFYGRAQLRMALNENQAGRWEVALSMLDTLSNKLPTQYEPLVARGDLLRTHQRYDDAVEMYTQALKRIPDIQSYHWPIYFARGVCLERQSKWAAAVADLKQALKLKPNQPDVLNYLGYSWLLQHDNLEEAQGMIEKAASLRPNDPQIADSMGWMLYSQAKYGEAASYLEKALEQLPSDPTINNHLGDAYWKLGRKTEARYQWERSLSFSPDPDEASEIQKKLKGGLSDNEASAKPPVVAEGSHPDISLR